MSWLYVSRLVWSQLTSSSNSARISNQIGGMRLQSANNGLTQEEQLTIGKMTKSNYYVPILDISLFSTF